MYVVKENFKHYVGTDRKLQVKAKAGVFAQAKMESLRPPHLALNCTVWAGWPAKPVEILNQPL